MKNKRYLFLLVYLAFLSQATSAAQTADRFNFDLQMNEEGSFNPELFVPIYWSANWFSGVGFRDSNSTTQSVIDGFTDSKFSTSINRRETRLNLISYQAGSEGFAYSIGGDYQINSIDKSEFGYFLLETGTVNDYVAFDNNIEIEVTGIALRGDLTWGKLTDTNTYRLSAFIAPANTLNVNQNTDFKPLVSEPGVSNSSKSQSMTYLIKFETRHDISQMMSIGFNLRHEVLPLEYDLQVLDSSASGFQNVTIDTTETTTSIGLRVIFNHPLVEGLNPVLGVTSEDIETKDNLNGGSESRSQILVSLGFTGRF